MDWVRKASGSAVVVTDSSGRVLLLRRASTIPGEVADHGFFAADALPGPMNPSTRRRLLDGLTAADLPLPVTLPSGTQA